MLAGDLGQLAIGAVLAVAVGIWARRDWQSEDRTVEVLVVIFGASFVCFLGAMGGDPNEPPITAHRGATAALGILGVHALFGLVRFGGVRRTYEAVPTRRLVKEYPVEGALMGAGLAAIAFIPLVLLTVAGELSGGWALALLATYVTAGAGLGLLLAVAWPLTRFPLGLMALGMLGCFAGYGAVGLFLAGSGLEDVSFEEVPRMGFLIAICAGAAWGYLIPGQG